MVIQEITPQEFMNQRLDRWLKNKYPTLPYSVLQKWLRTGQIRLNGKRVKGSTLIKGGEQIKLPLPQGESAQKAASRPIPKISLKTLELLRQNIIFEDKDCCILNKPIGLAVQGGTQIKDYLDLYLKELCPHNTEPLRLTHRLDKDTSGVLLLAKNYTAARYFTTLFKQGRIQKRYLAIVVGIPPQKEGFIDEPIHKKVKNPSESQSIPKKEALTEYKVLATTKHGFSFLELFPKTGRTHQLRIHCALSLGCPILGDGKYGGKEAHPFPKRVPMHLHAFQITIPFPTGQSQKFTAPLPHAFQKTVTEYFGAQNFM